MSFLDRIVGQERAVVALRAALADPLHAYLFIGRDGSQKRETALAFAADLLNDKRVIFGFHPDVKIVEREGAFITVEQAREISQLAARTPVEGNKKVLILEDFHLVANAAPALLKTIEESSPSTIFLILAEYVAPELVTVASRCVRVDFSTLTNAHVKEALVNEGIAPSVASELAESSLGNLDRARLLANDAHATQRRMLWVGARGRLNGTGSARAVIVADILAAIDAAGAHVDAQHEEELKAKKADVKEGTVTTTALKSLEASQKRAVRRFRGDELRAGFALLSHEYARLLQLAPDQHVLDEVDVALAAINWANRSMVFHPNESALLHGLFAKLDEAKIAKPGKKIR